MQHLKTAVVAAVVCGLMTVSVAGAASLITGSKIASNTITSRNIKNGSLALADLSPAARKALQGANGTNGAAGGKGDNGAAGANGTSGAKGDTGANGANGAKGDAGAKGDKGDTGAQGPKGDIGAPGEPGAKGDTGATGAKGDTGATGATGAKGDTGAQGPAGPAGLPGDFGFTNNTLKLTSNGVEFGPYADGGCQVSGCGGSLYYGGLNGKTLADITDLVYRAKYSTSDDITNGVPYLRIFTEGDTHDVIFSPNTQATPDVAEDVFHNWDVTAGTVRYDNDSGGPGPDPTWADTVTAHGTDVISGIYITTGFSAGADLSAVVRQLTVNGKVFPFGS